MEMEVGVSSSIESGGASGSCALIQLPITNGEVAAVIASTSAAGETKAIITDEPATSEDEGGGGKLKRSCSAPMINQLLPQTRVSAPPTPTPPR